MTHWNIDGSGYTAQASFWRNWGAAGPWCVVTSHTFHFAVMDDYGTLVPVSKPHMGYLSRL